MLEYFMNKKFQVVLFFFNLIFIFLTLRQLTSTKEKIIESIGKMTDGPGVYIKSHHANLIRYNTPYCSSSTPRSVVVFYKNGITDYIPYPFKNLPQSGKYLIDNNKIIKLNYDGYTLGEIDSTGNNIKLISLLKSNSNFYVDQLSIDNCLIPNQPTLPNDINFIL